MCRFGLAAVALLAAACAEPESESDMPGVPPWHMWGNSLTVEVPWSVAILNVVTSQILRVNYKRPESFNFHFAATLASIPEPVNPGQIRVSWDLIIGLGRSHTQIAAFEQYIFTFPGPVNPTGQMKYSTQVVTPPRIDGTATSASIIDHLIAEDITLNARIDFGGLGPYVVPAQVKLDAFIAPINHVRPDWFVDDFTGEELGGH